MLFRTKRQKTNTIVRTNKPRERNHGMIERYTLPEMGHIWSLENKFDVWKEIEVLACEAQA